MLEWGKFLSPQMKTEISAEGLTNALIIARKEERRKNFDHEVIVWFHLVSQVLGYPGALPSYKMHIDQLFNVMMLPVNVSLFNKGVRTYMSDEVPTDFMRDLYRQFLRWKQLPREKRKRYDSVEAYKTSGDVDGTKHSS